MHEQEQILDIIGHYGVRLRGAGVCFSLHYFFAYGIIIIAEVYSAVRILALAHLAVAIKAHDLYRIIVESEYLRLREKFAITGIKTMCKIPGHFQVLFLVFTFRF